MNDDDNSDVEQQQQQQQPIIHSMVMNSTGERLAILFDKGYSASAGGVIALFTTSEDPVFTATPR